MSRERTEEIYEFNLFEDLNEIILHEIFKQEHLKTRIINKGRSIDHLYKIVNNTFSIWIVDDEFNKDFIEEFIESEYPLKNNYRIHSILHVESYLEIPAKNRLKIIYQID